MSRLNPTTILLAVALAYAGWLGLAVVSQHGRLSATEKEVEGIIPRLQRIEDKLDRVLNGRRVSPPPSFPEKP